MSLNEMDVDTMSDDFDNDDFDDDFVKAGQDDDDFGDYNDFEEPESIPNHATLYNDILCHKPTQLDSFLSTFTTQLWHPIDTKQVPFYEKNILNATTSQELWKTLSQETVFYNPVTGTVGQFQWTRSETNKAYLNALGVTFHGEQKTVVTKKRQSHSVEKSRMTVPVSPIVEKPVQHVRSISSGGLKVVTTSKMDETITKEAEQELELDIDIAKAYCELTEDTIRIFPNVKLNAMVTELSRLKKQASEYLDSLLDQREQLKMDAETYNDLISCIVGHAQRLHIHTKDGSPAMVTKTKKQGAFSNMMKRKTVSSAQSVSMGGGVVGLKKQQAPKPNRTLSSNTPVMVTSDTRRSL